MINSSTQSSPYALNHVAITVPDLGQGVTWYADKLATKVVDRWADEATGMAWAHLAIGDLVLELVQMPNFEPAPGRTYGFHHLGLTVADCDVVVGKLRAAGVEIMREPSNFDRHAIRWAFVRDYLGNVIEIISPLTPAAS